VRASACGVTHARVTRRRDVIVQVFCAKLATTSDAVTRARAHAAVFGNLRSFVMALRTCFASNVADVREVMEQFHFQVCVTC
jgi:hypothetical protein